MIPRRKIILSSLMLMTHGIKIFPAIIYVNVRDAITPSAFISSRPKNGEGLDCRWSMSVMKK